MVYDDVAYRSVLIVFFTIHFAHNAVLPLFTVYLQYYIITYIHENMCVYPLDLFVSEIVYKF